MGPGDQHLGPAGAPAHLHHVHPHVLALGQLLALDLLAGGQHGLRGLRAGADAQGDAAGAGVDAADLAGEDLMLLGVELVVDHAPLGLPQALNNDLLAVPGGDAPELHIVDGDVHQAADVRPPVFQQGLLQGDLRAGPLHLRHDLLLYIHLQILARLVHVHHHILHALVVLLVGRGQGLDDLIHHKGGRDAPLLFQKGQGGKNFIAFHILYS